MHDLFASWERAGAGDLSAVHRQLAAHRRARTRSCSTGPPACVRRTPPADHPADRPHTPAGRHRAAPTGKWRGPGSPSTPPRRRSTRPTTRGACSTPTRTPGRWSCPTPTTVAALKTLLPDHRGHPAAGRGLEQRPQRLPQRRRSTRPTCSTCVEAGMPVEDTEDAVVLHAALGGREGRRRSPPTRTRRCAASTRPRSRKARATPRRAPRCSWRRSRPRSARPTDAGAAPGLARRAGAARRHRARPRPALADPGPARDPRRDRPRPSSEAALDGRAHRAARASSTPRAMASLPDAEAKAWAWQRLHRRGRRAQLRARGGRARHVAGRPGGPAPRRTSTATSPTLPGTVEVRSGWVLADAAEDFFPLTSVTRGDPRRAARADRRRGLDLSIRRRLVDQADELRATARRPAGLPRPMSGRERAPAPPRTHGPDPGARAHRDGRTAARGPAGHRGAARDPARLARARRRAGSG